MLKRYLLPLLCFVIACGTRCVVCEEIPRPPQVLIKLLAYEGDPNGSIEKGTIKVLAAPQLLTPLGKSATINAGEELKQRNPFGEPYFNGLRVTATPVTMKDGNVYVDIDYKRSRLTVEDDRVIASGGESSQTAVWLTPGKTVEFARYTRGHTDATTGKVLEVRYKWLTATCEILPPAPKVRITVTESTGDPQGSVAKGTVTILARSTVVVPVGETGSLEQGKEYRQLIRGGQPFFNGIRLKTTPTWAKDDKLHIELDYKHTKLEFVGDRVAGEGPERNVFTSVDIKPGETLVLCGMKEDRISAAGKVVTTDAWIDVQCELLPEQTAHRAEQVSPR